MDDGLQRYARVDSTLFRRRMNIYAQLFFVLFFLFLLHRRVHDGIDFLVTPLWTYQIRASLKEDE